MFDTAPTKTLAVDSIPSWNLVFLVHIYSEQQASIYIYTLSSTKCPLVRDGHSISPACSASASASVNPQRWILLSSAAWACPGCFGNMAQPCWWETWVLESVPRHFLWNSPGSQNHLPTGNTVSLVGNWFSDLIEISDSSSIQECLHCFGLGCPAWKDPVRMTFILRLYISPCGWLLYQLPQVSSNHSRRLCGWETINLLNRVPQVEETARAGQLASMLSKVCAVEPLFCELVTFHT